MKIKNKRSRFLILSLLAILTISNCFSKLTLATNEDESKQEDSKKNFVICIDPGHQVKGDNRLEPVAPGSSNKKARVSSGTAGVGTKKAEYEVNLQASLILKDILSKRGYDVFMTRETNDVSISNAERAEMANNKKADMTIRIHCDSINNSGKTGSTILVPAKNGKYTLSIYEKSNEYALLLKDNLKNNGIKCNGIFERNDITGFNWSKVPVIIFEMGFMSNWNEDQMLLNKDYQTKLMECVANSLDSYKDNITN